MDSQQVDNLLSVVSALDEPNDTKAALEKLPYVKEIVAGTELKLHSLPECLDAIKSAAYIAAPMPSGLIRATLEYIIKSGVFDKYFKQMRRVDSQLVARLYRRCGCEKRQTAMYEICNIDGWLRSALNEYLGAPPIPAEKIFTARMLDPEIAAIIGNVELFSYILNNTYQKHYEPLAYHGSANVTCLKLVLDKLLAHLHAKQPYPGQPSLDFKEKLTEHAAFYGNLESLQLIAASGLLVIKSHCIYSVVKNEDVATMRFLINKGCWIDTVIRHIVILSGTECAVGLCMEYPEHTCKLIECTLTNDACDVLRALHEEKLTGVFPCVLAHTIMYNALSCFLYLLEAGSESGEYEMLEAAKSSNFLYLEALLERKIDWDPDVLYPVVSWHNGSLLQKYAIKHDPRKCIQPRHHAAMLKNISKPALTILIDYAAADLSIK